jgi:neurofibromin 1
VCGMLRLQTIAQTYLKPSVTLWQNPAWIEICVLTRINMLLAFEPSDSLGTRLYLPELIHIITLLVGSGSVTMRAMLYKLSVNMLQSLSSMKATEEMDGTYLLQALGKIQSEEVTRSFGLVKVGNVLEGINDGPSEHGEVDAALLDRVENIAGFLGDVLAAAAPDTGKCGLPANRSGLIFRLRQCLEMQMDELSGWHLFPAQSGDPATGHHSPRIPRFG